MATITVTNLNDGGVGSLRQAIADAEALAGDDTIVFDASLSGGTIHLASVLDINASADTIFIEGDIDGDGSQDITVSGDTNNDGTGDVSLLNNNGNLSVNGVIFDKGRDSGFSSYIVSNGIGDSLTLTNTVISNSVIDSSSGLAGTILNAGDLTLSNVLIENATANLTSFAVGAAGIASFGVSTTNIDQVGVTGTASSADSSYVVLGINNYGTLGGGILAIGAGDTGEDGTGLINRGSGTGTLTIGVSGDSSANTINGTTGSDTILGFGGDDTLNGGDGNDSIFGGAGNDTLSGGKGSDTIYGGAGDDLIAGPVLLGDGTISNTGDGFDVIYGGDGNDTITGGFYRDTIFGGDGDDVIRIDFIDRVDEIDGGAGRDLLDASGAVTRIIVSGNGSGGLTLEGQGAGTQPFANVEAIIATPGADDLRDTVSGSDLFFEGRVGDDTLISGSGDDSLFGGDGVDSLDGGSGNDNLYGGAGLDNINGGAGDDLIVLTGVDDVDDVDGGDDIDTLDFKGIQLGRSVEVDLHTGTFEISVNGTPQGVVGSVVNVEVVIGGSGDDTLTGANGNDTLTGANGNDQIVSTFGDDVIDAGAGDDRVVALSGNNDQSGGADDDLMVGGVGNDTLDGGSGNDVIVGDISSRFVGGADRLIGGTGDDLMMGGAGADVFVFALGDGTDEIGKISVNVSDPTASTIAGADFVSGVDKIELQGFGFADTGEALAAFSDVNGNAVFSHAASSSSLEIHGLSVADLSSDDFILT